MTSFGEPVGVDHTLEQFRVQRRQKVEGVAICGRRRPNHIIRTLYRFHGNTRDRTMVRTAHWVLVWVRHACNVLIYITTHGVIVRETTAPATQDASGRVSPSPRRVGGTAGGDDK